MSSSVQKLFLQLSLIDKITEPSRTVCKSVESVRQAWKFAAREFAYSGALMSGTVSSLHNLSLPAREFSKALGEVARSADNSGSSARTKSESARFLEFSSPLSIRAAGV